MASTTTIITPNENTKVTVLVPADPNESIDKYLDPEDLEEDAGQEAIDESEDVEATSDTGKTKGSPLDNLPVVRSFPLYDYRDYKPRGTAIVWSGFQQIYRAPLQNLYGRVTRHLENMHWAQITSWRNDMSTDNVFQISFTTSLRITEGSEVTRGFNLGATYKGLSIGVDGSRRTFTETETSTSRTITINITVPANSLMVLYQRRFDFRDETNFRHYRNTWGRSRAVTVWDADAPLETKISRVQILSEDYFAATSFLPNGPGSMDVTNVPQEELPSDTMQRNQTTPRARRELSSMGL
ncbi:hypothetical protein CVT24_013231 [Panaeolus cyanescens]|uniref:Uncharacterized protein n=1 Tax=Panaeolus cyanescens TaxID=181874 RepID=A0A409YP51_9AGAR|nr:hypothetical protein CVT24_013231 [Panaeolus cyanescens]